MPTLTTDKTSLNFDELQQNPQSEVCKTAYLNQCFNVAKNDLEQGKVVDGETFLSAL